MLGYFSLQVRTLGLGRAFPVVLRSLRKRWEQGDKDAIKEAIEAAVAEVDEAVETLPEDVRWIIKELVRIGRAQIRPNKLSSIPLLIVDTSLPKDSFQQFQIINCLPVRIRNSEFLPASDHKGVSPYLNRSRES